MIALLQLPSYVTLARNQNLALFRVTDPDGRAYGPRGAEARITVDTASSPGLTDGDTITLEYTSFPGAAPVTIVFTGSAAVGANNLPLLAGTVDAPYMISVISKIAAHPQVAPFFTIDFPATTGTEYAIALVANDTLEDWAPTFAVVGPSGWTVADTAALPDNTPDNHRVIVELFWEVGYLGGGFRRVAAMQPAYDRQGLVWLHLQDLFTAQWQATQATVPIPQDITQPTRADNLRRYYLRYTEASGNPLEYDEFQSSAVQMVMWGGVGNRYWSAGNPLDGLTDIASLLHYYPSGKPVAPRQPEWLAWYNYTGEVVTLQLELVATANDNTDEAPIILYPTTPLTLQPGETALFPAGPQAVQVDTATVRKYTLTVQKNTGDTLSEPRTYWIDNLYHEDMRILQYLNSFGIPETLRCTGRLSHNLKIDRGDTRRNLDVGYFGPSRERIQWDFEGEPVYTYRSGYLPPQAVRALQELMLYNEVWEAITPGNWRAMHVLNRSMPLPETGQVLNAVEIQATPSISMGNYDPTDIGGAYDWNLPPGENELQGISYWTINDDFIVTP